MADEHEHLIILSSFFVNCPRALFFAENPIKRTRLRSAVLGAHFFLFLVGRILGIGPPRGGGGRRGGEGGRGVGQRICVSKLPPPARAVGAPSKNDFGPTNARNHPLFPGGRFCSPRSFSRLFGNVIIKSGTLLSDRPYFPTVLATNGRNTILLI